MAMKRARRRTSDFTVPKPAEGACQCPKCVPPAPAPEMTNLDLVCCRCARRVVMRVRMDEVDMYLNLKSFTCSASHTGMKKAPKDEGTSLTASA